MGSCGEGNDTVVVNVGGEKFEVLRQTIEAKPETLLCTLLHDPAGASTKEHHGTASAATGVELFVEADPKRFRYILDWYRYGSICLPCSISVQEMRRECAYFQLPDDLKISRERPSPTEGVAALQAALDAAKEEIAPKLKKATEEAVSLTVLSRLLHGQVSARGTSELEPPYGEVSLTQDMEADDTDTLFGMTVGDHIARMASEEARNYGWTVECRYVPHTEEQGRKKRRTNRPRFRLVPFKETTSD
mmetsp:Transcript_12271/g.28671  ORF Transcript_12271/g.28671 Transcript_12271/m.28671 type:complete len:247 (+) Transcript_12271:59-799(+)